jgi:hypothetical protein
LAVARRLCGFAGFGFGFRAVGLHLNGS